MFSTPPFKKGNYKNSFKFWVFLIVINYFASYKNYSGHPTSSGPEVTEEKKKGKFSMKHSVPISGTWWKLGRKVTSRFLNTITLHALLKLGPSKLKVRIRSYVQYLTASNLVQE